MKKILLRMSKHHDLLIFSGLHNNTLWSSYLVVLKSTQQFTSSPPPFERFELNSHTSRGQELPGTGRCSRGPSPSASPPFLHSDSLQRCGWGRRPGRQSRGQTEKFKWKQSSSCIPAAARGHSDSVHLPVTSIKRKVSQTKVQKNNKSFFLRF